jgi:hypothetical protein
MIPPTTHRAYRDLVLGERQVELKCLALKIYLGRLQMSALADPSDENVDKHVEALQKFFSRNEQIAKRDMETIFGPEAL